jgi:hypothetical protein
MRSHFVTASALNRVQFSKVTICDLRRAGINERGCLAGNPGKNKGPEKGLYIS